MNVRQVNKIKGGEDMHPAVKIGILLYKFYEKSKKY